METITVEHGNEILRIGGISVEEKERTSTMAARTLVVVVVVSMEVSADLVAVARFVSLESM